MKKKIFNIISGAKSGALNIAVTLGAYLAEQGYQVDTILRKYNKTDLQAVTVVKDRCTVDYICALAARIKRERPDLILVHGYSTHIWTKLAVAKAGVPVKLIHVEHNAERYTPFRSWLTRKMDAYTDRYICVSQGVVSHLLQQGVSADKVSVVYNGIERLDFVRPKKKHAVYTVGMTARFTKQKDQLTLIKAIEYLVQEKQMEVQLLLLGTGKTRRNCEDYVKTAGLQDVISFRTGAFSEIVSELDVFVLSTHYEGFGLVLCEAMAADLPVIATDVAGANEIVCDGETGFLVPENDSRALAEKILYCCKLEPAVLQSMRAAASQALDEKFSQAKMCEAYAKHISELLK